MTRGVEAPIREPKATLGRREDAEECHSLIKATANTYINFTRISRDGPSFIWAYIMNSLMRVRGVGKGFWGCESLVKYGQVWNTEGKDGKFI